MKSNRLQLIIVFALFALIYAGCKKDVTVAPVDRIKLQLRSQVDPSVFDALNFDSLFITGDSARNIVSIGFGGEALAEHFVLLVTDQSFTIRSGRIVEMRTTLSASNSIEGRINMTGLDGRVILDNVIIHNGYLQRHALGISLRDMIVPGDAGSALPLVVLVSSYSNNVMQWTTYYSMLGMTGSGAPNTYYAPNPSTGVYYGNESRNHKDPNGGGPSTLKSTVINIDFEAAQAKAAIDIEKYVKCFSNVPDAGAICSIEIFTDIPVDAHPEDFFDWRTGSPGHTFLRIQKTNGSNSVVQFLGFYPVSGWKTFATPAPISGKFVDNGLHEFNASFKMNLTAAQLQSVLLELIRHKNDKYDIDEYNCTDWALEIFNYQRTSKVTIPKYNLPGAQAPLGSNTPQGLYNQLKTMKAAGGTEAINISIPGVKGYVAYGTGPCN
jgi:hypothetical protein